MTLDHPLWIVLIFISGIVLITITRKYVNHKNGGVKGVLQKLLFLIGALLLVYALLIIISGLATNF